jgi:hypothetical protein
MATGSPVLVYDSGGAGRIRRINYTWTSTGAGAVITDALRLSGLLMACETKPGTGGTQPTSYNIQVRRGGNTTAFYDMLNASGALRSITLPECCHPVDANNSAILEPFRDEDIYVMIDTAGASKTGEFTLFVLQEG